MCIVEGEGRRVPLPRQHRPARLAQAHARRRCVWTVGAPLESGKYEKAEQFHPTSIAVVPDGTIFVADGYGLSWVHQYDARRQVRALVRRAGADELLPRARWSTRAASRTTLLVADRENHRLLRFDLEGKPAGRDRGDVPPAVQRRRQRDGYLVVRRPRRAASRSWGRTTELVSSSATTPTSRSARATTCRARSGSDGVFLSPHSAHWDREGNLYVMDWNSSGRVNKLRARCCPRRSRRGVGYDDTPLLPGSKWHVHDPNRPPPPVVRARREAARAGAARTRSCSSTARTCRTGRAATSPRPGRSRTATPRSTARARSRRSENFGDCQLHLEWSRRRAEAEGEQPGPRQQRRVPDGPLRGAGARLASRTRPTPTARRRRSTASTRRWSTPAATPGEWQSYDIVFRAPRFDGDEARRAPARVTVFHNGVLVHDARGVPRRDRAPRAGAATRRTSAELPLSLQDHGNPVRYRNIWVRKL